jgi:broad specificity phosphatase PhoE
MKLSAAMALELLLLRHGETAWSLSGQHTGRTDLPLLPSGRAQAEALRPLLAPLSFVRVLSSPLRRARETAELAGLKGIELDDDLREWNYGEDEGLTTQQILAKRPAWNFWEEGCPGGERPDEVGARCDRVLGRLGADPVASGQVAIVAHGHLLRVFVARWLGFPAGYGRDWVLSPASLTRLGHEHGQPVILGLNRGTP